MPKYVIEREIPGAGQLTADQLHAVSQTSCGVLNTLGPQIQWVHSYVTDDKIYCVYNAPNEEMIRQHASQGGFPANRISRVASIIDPTTAEWGCGARVLGRTPRDPSGPVPARHPRSREPDSGHTAPNMDGRDARSATLPRSRYGASSATLKRRSPLPVTRRSPSLA